MHDSMDIIIRLPTDLQELIMTLWNQCLKRSANKLLDSMPFYFCSMCKATSGRMFNSKHRLCLDYYKHTNGVKYVQECFCSIHVLTGIDTMHEILFVLQEYIVPH